MDLTVVVGSDPAILLMSAAGLLATAVAIVHDTRTQAAKLAREPIKIQ